MESRTDKISPAKVLIAAILIPGLGYWMIGQRWRTVLTGGGIIGLFVLGIFFAGIRVISVPGYDEGYPKYIESSRSGDGIAYSPTTRPIVEVRDLAPDMGNRRQYMIKRRVPGGVLEEITTARPMGEQWIMLYSPMGVIGDNLWFLGQMLTGPLCAVSGYLSIAAAQTGIERSYGRLADIGSLYTAVAGMLNLLVIVDCVSRANGGGRKR